MGAEVEYKHYFLGLNQKSMSYLLESRNQMGEWASVTPIQKSGKPNLEGRERGAFAGSPHPEKQSRRSPLNTREQRWVQHLPTRGARTVQTC